MKWIKKKEKFTGIARQTQKLKKRGRKMRKKINGVRDKLVNLYMHTSFFMKNTPRCIKSNPKTTILIS